MISRVKSYRWVILAEDKVRVWVISHAYRELRITL